jgi:hypothetical protein
MTSRDPSTKVDSNELPEAECRRILAGVKGKLTLGLRVKNVNFFQGRTAKKVFI